jgi:capsular polysaccharide biosynthesis protein
MKNLLRAILRHDPGICPDVRRWCETHPQGEIVTVLQPPRRITRRLPRTTELEVAAIFHSEATFDTYERFVGLIRKARIVGDNGYIRLPDGQFAHDYLTIHAPLTTEHPLYFQRWPRGVRRRHWRGSYFSLVSVYCRGYYHWIHDALAALHQVLEWLPPSTRIIVPDGLSDVQIRLLEAMNVPAQRICCHHSNEIVTVDELYFVPPLTKTRFDDPEVTQWLSDRLRKAFVEPSAVPGQKSARLYVSRAKAARRRIVNESEVLAVLQPLGFEVIHAEDLSVDQQAACFAGAEMIVAPHGAGLTNLYFSTPGTKVIEILFDPIEYRSCYWSLSEAMGMEYIYTVGEAVEIPNTPEKDIHLPSHQLRAALRMAGLEA